MSQNRVVQCFLTDSTQTDRLGSALASYLSPGNLVLLNGTLGAGKSALARATIRELLKLPDLEVPSPTFLLVLPYQNQNVSILHADLYRLKNEGELDELGLFEEPDTITFVEWPERAPHLVEQADLIIDLKFLPEKTGRIACFSCPKSSKTFDALAQDSIFGDGIS